jgi:lipopolysaccharide biosynthesis regulator YciM
MKAGLYDRAESLFQELAEVSDYNEQALRLLMRIYQQEREWESAISVARRLAALSDDRIDDVIAQYECELGEAALAKNNLSLARRCGERALSTDATCVRASMLLGRLALAEGRPEEALRLFRRVEDQDSRFIDEVIADIARCYRSIGDTAGLADYFRHLSSRHPTIGVQLAQADFLRQQHGVETSEQFVVEWVRRHPSPQGLHRLVELHIEETTGAAREDLVILRGILEALIGKERGYGCTHCGFRAKSLYWSCPGCGRWKTFVQRTDLNETGPDTSAIIE